MEAIMEAHKPPFEVAVGPWSVPPLKLTGKTEKAKVSAAGEVFQGEFIQKVFELEPVDEMRFALENTKVLCAAKTGDKRISVAFAQRGATYLKAIKYVDNQIVFGKVITLAEEELGTATIVDVGADRVAVLFNADAAGQVAVVAYNDCTGTLLFTDIWDDEDPCNIVADKLQDGRLIVSCLRQDVGGAKRAYLCAVDIGEAVATVHTAAELDAEYDDDEYAGAWAISALSPRRAVVSYYKTHASPIGFSMLNIAEDGAIGVYHTGACVYMGSLPATSILALNETMWAVVNGISRVDAAGKVVKTTMAFELWQATEYGAQPSWYSIEAEDFGVNLGRVNVRGMQPAAAITYTLDNTARCMLVDITQRGPEGYPAVQLTSFDEYCLAVPFNATYAFLVYQKDGNGYAQLTRRVETVITGDTQVHGVARTGGGAGATISITTN